VGLDIDGETVQQTGSSFLWWMLMVVVLARLARSTRPVHAYPQLHC